MSSAKRGKFCLGLRVLNTYLMYLVRFYLSKVSRYFRVIMTIYHYRVSSIDHYLSLSNEELDTVTDFMEVGGVELHRIVLWRWYQSYFKHLEHPTQYGFI